MPPQSHLRRRGSRWYWRRRVPHQLIAAFGRRELVQALLTANRDIACRLARRLDVAADALFEKVARSMSKFSAEQLRKFAVGVVEMELAHLEQCRAEDPDLTHDRAVALFDASRAEAEGYKACLMENDFSTIEPLMVEIAERLGWRIDPSDSAWRELGRSALRALSEAYFRDARRCVGEYDEDRGAPFGPPALWTAPTAPAVQAAPAAAAAPKLSNYLDAWIAQGKTSGWKEQTADANRRSAKLFLDIAGDRALVEYTRKEVEELRKTMEALPSNWGKSSRHKTMPTAEIIAGRDEETLTLCRQTLELHWSRMKSFLQWARTQQPNGTPIDLSLLTEAHKWSAEVPEGQSRIPWDEPALDVLMNSPVWRGCLFDPENRHRRHEKGPDIVRDEYWWLPPLAILHGGRMEEYCCLTGDDVFDIDGIPVMDINKGLKTGSSRRVVPINDWAIQCGFLDLATKAGGGRLFPLMEPGGRYRRYSYHFSEWFTEYRRKIAIYAILMDYHSFRTGATSRIVHSGFSILLADEITGHDSKARREVKEHQSITLDYLSNSDLKQRRDAVNSINLLAKYDHLRAAPGFSRTTGKERGSEIRERLMKHRKVRQRQSGATRSNFARPLPVQGIRGRESIHDDGGSPSGRRNSVLTRGGAHGVYGGDWVPRIAACCSMGAPPMMPKSASLSSCRRSPHSIWKPSRRSAMIRLSSCPSWQPDTATRPAEEHRSNTTSWDTILCGVLGLCIGFRTEERSEEIELIRSIDEVPIRLKPTSRHFIEFD
jgi:integrase